MQIHELNGYTGALSDAYMVVDNGSDTGKKKIKDITDPLDARIDNIIAGGDAPSAAEIIDARLGADGVTYPSLGDAIRTQVTDLTNGLDSFSKFVYPTNIYDQTQATNGCRLQSSGTTYETPDYFTSGYIDVSFVGNNKLFCSTGIYGLNMYYVCFYDINKNIISYSSSVANNIQNNTSAKYMRFSAQTAYYPANQMVSITYGSARGSYSDYFAPYRTIETAKLENYIKTNAGQNFVTFAYSAAGSSFPKISLLSGSVSVYVDGIISYHNILTGDDHIIQRYNSTPETFSIGNNKALVLDVDNLELSVINTADISAGFIPLLVLNSQGIVTDGCWISYLNQQVSYEEYKEPSIPFSPRISEITESSYAADQSVCVVGDWIVCFDGEDSDGLVYILDGSSLDRIKTMTHSIGHAGRLSYCSETDALLILDEDKTYLLPNAEAYIDDENNTDISPADCIIYNALLGVFGESKDITYQSETLGPYDTIRNMSVKRYVLEMSGSTYTGNYSLDKTYTDNYRMPVTQDAQFYNGYLYQGVGYGYAAVYKIKLTEPYKKYEIAESYEIPNNNDYEMEGVTVESGYLLTTVRRVSDITKKYFVKMPLL